MTDRGMRRRANIGMMTTMQTVSLVGRQDERKRIVSLLEDVSVHGASLFITGDPGIGKSALLATACSDAAARGMWGLRSAGAAPEEHLPYAALHRLLHPLLNRLDVLPEVQREVLLGTLVRSQPDAGDRFDVALATLLLLREHARNTPLLVVVDDMQWLDPWTATVLAFVARRIEDDPIVLIGATRGMPSEEFADVPHVDIALDPLDETSADRLVTAQAPHLQPSLRERVLAEASGNPGALVELAVAWERLPKGTVFGIRVPVTARWERMFAARVAALPSSSRTLVLVAAMNDSSSLEESLAAASIVEGLPVTRDDLAHAIEARLVSLDVRGVHFRTLARSSISQSADANVRRATHSALASVLADDDRVTWHRAAALLAPDETVADALERTASRARRRGDLVDAILMLERAAEVSPEPAKRGRRLVHAADCAYDLGRQDVVERLLDEAEPLTLDPVDRARAAWRRQILGDAACRDVAQVRALVAITDRMRLAGDSDTVLDALMPVAETAWWTDFDLERRDLVASAAEQVSPTGHDPRLLLILAMTAPTERGADVIERLRQTPPSAVDDPGGLWMLGTAAGILGDHGMAAYFLDHSMRGLRAQGRVGELANALVSRAWAFWALGQWDAAIATADEAVRLGEQIEREAVSAAARLVGAAVAAARGDSAAAEATAEEVSALFRPLGAVTMLTLASLVRGIAMLVDGRAEEAYDHLRPVVDNPGLGAASTIALGAVPTFVDAAVQIGRRDDARAVITRLEERSRDYRSPAAIAALVYSKPVLAADDDAEQLYAAALDSELTNWPFLHGRLLLSYGTWLRRQRRINDARLPLRGAREICDQLGADPWGERARQELRATGEASAQRAKGKTVERLTAQELEIARLAASGLTNREIGRRLFLSSRTIGSHLYRVFPKLGIASRHELARALGEDEPGE